jgi:hypothetical protein
MYKILMLAEQCSLRFTNPGPAVGGRSDSLRDRVCEGRLLQLLSLRDLGALLKLVVINDVLEEKDFIGANSF